MILKAIIFFCLVVVQTQATVVVQCVFSGRPYYNEYKCTIDGAVITDPNEEVLIARLHLSGGTDANVRYVEFKNSQLSHIPNEFFDTFRGMYYMYAQETNLTSIGELRNCGSLQTLYVFSNKLSELPTKSISACSSLIYIHAGTNQITELEPGLLSNFRNLEKFYINHNKLTELREGALHTTTPNLH
jgi:hypothetical protein